MTMFILFLLEVCYLSQGPQANGERRCATERVEAVTGLDIMYEDFQKKTMGSMEASDFKKSCGQLYDCPDGEPECSTRFVLCIVLKCIKIINDLVC